MSKRPLQKVRAIYTGRVQGVGFRANVLQVARRYPVTGTVCNVSDGSVELVATGQSSDLMKLLQDVDQCMSRNIVHCTVDWGDGDEQEFSEFSIAPDKWGG